MKRKDFTIIAIAKSVQNQESIKIDRDKCQFTYKAKFIQIIAYFSAVYRLGGL